MSSYPDYLVCYDIANTKRLQKLARALEKIMIRVQYSVFVAPAASQSTLFEIIGTINDIINEQSDDVRIYTIAEKGHRSKEAKDLDDLLIIC